MYACIVTEIIKNYHWLNKTSDSIVSIGHKVALCEATRSVLKCSLMLILNPFCSLLVDEAHQMLPASFKRLQSPCWLHCVQKLSKRYLMWFSSEHDGARDMAPLISSLVQLLLDPHTRSLLGFQALIEKEWVVMGHRFKDRYGLVTVQDGDDHQVIIQQHRSRVMV